MLAYPFVSRAPGWDTLVWELPPARLWPPWVVVRIVLTTLYSTVPWRRLSVWHRQWREWVSGCGNTSGFKSDRMSLNGALCSNTCGRDQCAHYVRGLQPGTVCPALSNELPEWLISHISTHIYQISLIHLLFVHWTYQVGLDCSKLQKIIFK